MVSYVQYHQLADEDTDVVHQAIFDGRTNALLKLLKDSDRAWDPNVPDKNGWTYLMHACWLAQENFVRLLLACNADVNLTRCKTRISPLHLAFARSDARLAARLLLVGADAHAVMLFADVEEDSAAEDSAHRHIREMKPHELCNQAFTAEVVAEYKSLKIEEPQQTQQHTWKRETAHRVMDPAPPPPHPMGSTGGNTSHATTLQTESVLASTTDGKVMLPAPPEPQGVRVGTTPAMRALLHHLPAPNIEPLGVDLDKLMEGGILRPPPFPQ